MKPNPGSEAAIEAGCTCPVIDNHHGKGATFRGEVAFWFNGDCPLHGLSRPTQGHDRASYRQGVRASIAWLHREADKMNDPHARRVLNSAAFGLGTDKPEGSDHE